MLFKLINLVSVSASLDESDDKSKPPVVQQRGRFKVTSENLDIEKVTVLFLVLRGTKNGFLFQSRFKGFLLYSLSLYQVVVPSPILQKSHSMQVCNCSEVSLISCRQTIKCLLPQLFISRFLNEERTFLLVVM